VKSFALPTASLDANLAKTLNDKKLDPALISFDKGVKLVIPSLEQGGQLPPEQHPRGGKVLLDGVLEQRAVVESAETASM